MIRVRVTDRVKVTIRIGLGRGYWARVMMVRNLGFRVKLPTNSGAQHCA